MEDWEKPFLYDLHHCQLIVPVVSDFVWERILMLFLIYILFLIIKEMKSDKPMSDKISKESEHIRNTIKEVSLFISLFDI